MTKIGPNDPCWCGSGVKYKKCHRLVDRTATSRSCTGPGALVSEPSLKTISLGRPLVQPGKIGPPRFVPPSIPRPEYAESGEPGSARGIHVVRTREQYQRMLRSCRTAREILEMVLAAVKPGITTDELDELAHEAAIKRGAYPSPLNYHHFPKSICTSVNEVICHGIPDDRSLREGDIVNCDVTVYLEGMHGDCSSTALVGGTSEEARLLVAATERALYAGIETVRPGGRVRDIGKAIESIVLPLGYSVVRAFVGHGLGTYFHMDPQIPHYYEARMRQAFQPGMTFTVEPMINQGTPQHVTWDDDWTAVTEDRQLSAQFEHTVLVTEKGPEILTLADGQAQPFLK